ncbi:MAG: hypothetical protein K9J25_12195 [Bacteroidales bacterium]|nr:hypothetical protein [Bacteroidales bacterium]
MNDIKTRFNTLNRLDLFFIIAGLVEIFCLVFLTSYRLLVLIGLITIISAYLPLKEDKIKWNYFVGIWALLKYNPLGLAFISFYLGDTAMAYDSTTATFVTGIVFFVLGIASLVLGIIIIVKTSKYLRAKEKIK